MRRAPQAAVKPNNCEKYSEYNAPLRGRSVDHGALHILMLAPCMFPSAQGTQVFIRQLATGLARAGHRVSVLCYGNRDDPELLGSTSAFDYLPIHSLLQQGLSARSGPQWQKPLLDMQLCYAAQRFIRQRKPDVVHVHNVEGAAIAALLRLVTRVPLVHHLHNAMRSELPTYVRGVLPQAVLRFMGGALDRTLPRMAHRCIVFDGKHARELQREGVHPSRIDIIPPGLDVHERHDDFLGECAGDEHHMPYPAAYAEALPTSRPEKASSEAGRMGIGVQRLLYAGNPDAYQNLPLLYRALIGLNDSAHTANVGGPVRLVIASHHPETAFAQSGLWRKARRHIEYIQVKTQAELRNVFMRCQVGVSPRTISTGLPIKVLNYLAMGLPVVACEEGVQGILEVHPGGSALHESGFFLVEGRAKNPSSLFAQACRQALTYGGHDAAFHDGASNAQAWVDGVFSLESGRCSIALPTCFHISAQVKLYEECYAKALLLQRSA